MAVFLARINPASGAPMNPLEAASVADQARQAYEARAAYWAQAQGGHDDDEEFPEVF